MPATAASRYCSGLSERSLCVTSVPSGRLPTTSVKVPPRSIQNCQRDVGAEVGEEGGMDPAIYRLANGGSVNARVIPAKAGIQGARSQGCNESLDPRLRG